MTLRVLVALNPDGQDRWMEALHRAAEAAGLDAELRPFPDDAPPQSVDALVYGAAGRLQDFRPYAGLRLIQCVWAGVEAVLANPTLPEGAPLARMVEPGLTEGMTDYVVAHVMRLHMGLHQPSGAQRWFVDVPPLSRWRRVGVLGLGQLGADAARALAGLRFDVAGWSRTPKTIPGVACLHGEDGLETLLRRSEILVGLLPATAATANLLDARNLALSPEGAMIVNAGRGELIDDAALLAALDARLGHATLDVFRQEPLPADHPFRTHPKVTVTPHVASATRPETAAPEVVAQLGRLSRNEPLLHVVDRARGY
jgi:glyoxylate/hydroxypyruvate reductase A